MFYTLFGWGLGGRNRETIQRGRLFHLRRETLGKSFSAATQLLESTEVSEDGFGEGSWVSEEMYRGPYKSRQSKTKQNK